jgi:GT2 family glycosyltransferase
MTAVTSTDGSQEYRPPYAVITVAYRSRAPLTALLQRLPSPIPVLVVDNSASDEDIRDLVAARPMTTYIDAAGNIGFGAACNLAARVTSQPLIAFVNPDADVDPTVLDQLAQQVSSDPQCSSCGPLLIGGRGRTLTGSGGWLPTPTRALVHAVGLFRLWPESGIWMAAGPSTPCEVEWIAGTCLMIRRDVFLEVGGFAQRYFLYQEDMDLGRRLHEKRYRQIVKRDVHVAHAAGTSSEHDVGVLAWLRASAFVDYMFATSHPLRSRLICAILASGATLRAAYQLIRGRSSRVRELGTQAATMAFPHRTLRRIQAGRR